MKPQRNPLEFTLTLQRLRLLKHEARSFSNPFLVSLSFHGVLKFPRDVESTYITSNGDLFFFFPTNPLSPLHFSQQDLRVFELFPGTTMSVSPNPSMPTPPTHPGESGFSPVIMDGSQLDNKPNYIRFTRCFHLVQKMSPTRGCC